MDTLTDGYVFVILRDDVAGLEPPYQAWPTLAQACRAMRILAEGESRQRWRLFRVPVWPTVQILSAWDIDLSEIHNWRNIGRTEDGNTANEPAGTGAGTGDWVQHGG